MPGEGPGQYFSSVFGSRTLGRVAPLSHVIVLRFYTNFCCSIRVKHLPALFQCIEAPGEHQRDHQSEASMKSMLESEASMKSMLGHTDLSSAGSMSKAGHAPVPQPLFNRRRFTTHPYV